MSEFTLQGYWGSDLVVDTITPQERSEIVSRVRSKNTKPEIAVRKIVWTMGKRYRLHVNGFIDVPRDDMTMRELLTLIVSSLPVAQWQETVLQGRVILYREHNAVSVPNYPPFSPTDRRYGQTT